VVAFIAKAPEAEGGAVEYALTDAEEDGPSLDNPDNSGAINTPAAN
jgi:hypothetical protein